MTSENEMDRKKRELHGSLQDSSGEEPPFKDYTKVLNNRGKKSGPINKKISELITVTHFDNKKIKSLQIN